MRCAWLVLLFASTASADELRPQLQIDGGLSVIGPAYEHPITKHIAVSVEVFIFGTYFLPWFDAGEDVKGFGGGVRPTWFARESGHGLYVAPYFRVVGVDDESIGGASGMGFTTGVFVGWAFRLSEKLDLRLGGGAQYIRFRADGPDGQLSTGTPFVAIDGLLGYRL
ncbi:MAG: hypothetical protein M4D80_28795 [Myxococcota bacterium]|nr:hypothetical protein [Myxococcota bacterium]